MDKAIGDVAESAAAVVESVTGEVSAGEVAVDATAQQPTAPADAATVIVNVGVVEGESPTEQEQEAITPVAASETAEDVAEITAEAESIAAPPVETATGNGVIDESTEPTELDSVAVERARLENEALELQNQRAEIENEALRNSVEAQAEDHVVEVGVTSDGRNDEAPGDKGKGASERTADPDSGGSGNGEAKATSNGGDKRAQSESGSGNRSGRREPRFRRGRS